MKQKIYVVGIGPGAPKMMTPQARQALEESDVIAGYPVYLKLLGDLVQNKKTIATPMTKEEERCRLCFEEAKKGCIASIVCSGDSGVYGKSSTADLNSRKLVQQLKLGVVMFFLGSPVVIFLIGMGVDDRHPVHYMNVGKSYQASQIRYEK